MSADILFPHEPRRVAGGIYECTHCRGTFVTDEVKPAECSIRLLAEVARLRALTEELRQMLAVEQPSTPSNTLLIQSIPEDMLDALRAQVAAGDPILAIRDLRARLGCTLAIAKRLIEEAFGPQGLRLKILPDGTVEVTR